MRQAILVYALLVLAAYSIAAQEEQSLRHPPRTAPDADGVYYVGPEISAPRLLRSAIAPYPRAVAGKEVQGITVLAMVIDEKGQPQHIQVLHHHGEAFDSAAIAAVKYSTFAPGMLEGNPVPVWIDVRVVFHANRSQAVPEILITERDLPPPNAALLENKHHKPLSYTPPFPIHTVDADFTDPFVKHPYVQVAVVTVLVGEDGLPKEVRVVRGLGFGLDKKAEAAVWKYRFLPATSKGRPIAARRDIQVAFAKF
jgi:TonB family protein